MVLPCWYKTWDPITIFKMYHQIKRIHHVAKLIDLAVEQDDYNGM